MRRPVLIITLLFALGACGPSTELYDFDGDGSLDSEDCSPTDPLVYPGASDSFGDGIDQDCDGSDGVDLDGDGYASLLSGGNDCVDNDPAVHPADDDEDGSSPCAGDCDDSDPTLNLTDLDQDLYSSCTGDCDDANPLLNPGQEEVCDLLDNNCDGLQASDEVDGDGDGDPACSDCDDEDADANSLDLDGDFWDTCGPDGIPESGDEDCNDGIPEDEFDPSNPEHLETASWAPLTWPGASDQVAGGVDTNCDGISGIDDDGDGFASATSGGLDCDDTDATLNYADADGDGYSTCPFYSGPLSSSEILGDDCDDADPVMTPVDVDGDGFSPCGLDQLPGTADDDCDDTNASMFPGNEELCDGFDNDCLGGPSFTNINGDELDLDGDGAVTCLNECDDNDPANFPGNPELCDGQDNDCNASTVGEADDDDDGHALCTDCNDSEPTAYPGALELCDLLDNNCDGQVDEGTDTDDDGDSWYECQGDCDDTDPAIHPGQWEDPSDGVDSNCDGEDGNSLSQADAIATGEVNYDYSGQEVASAGDVDGDGLDDLLIGAYLNDSGGTNAGATYLMLGSTVSAAVAAGSPTWDLSQADAIFLGEHSGDQSGRSVASAGDVDGDGLDDLVIGALENDNAESDAGATYLLLGSTVSAGIAAGSPTWDLSQADATFLGEHYDDFSGASVASAGDVDGDGLDDLLIGAPENDNSGSEAGATYLLLGSTVSAGIAAGSPTWDLSQADFIFLGENSDDRSGTSVASAGDIDGDGLDDLVIGALRNDNGATNAGTTYLMLGSTVSSGIASGTSTWDLSQADATFLGENISDNSGASVASAGDVDGDGFSDLLIGGKGNSRAGSAAGATYLMLGSTVSTGIAAGNSTWDLSQADATFLGEQVGDYSGASVASVGDVDGDGLADLVIGAYDNDRTSTDAGTTYLMLGVTVTTGIASGNPTWDLSQADFIFLGENSDDRSGLSVSSAGDIDGDGSDDLLIGALNNDNAAGANAGASYLLLSPY